MLATLSHGDVVGEVQEAASILIIIGGKIIFALGFAVVDLEAAALRRRTPGSKTGLFNF
jgi:hypothetical protein